MALDAPLAPSAEPTKASTPPAPVVNRCYPLGKPAPVVAIPVESGQSLRTVCRGLFDSELRAVEAALRKQYTPHLVPSRIFVSFSCVPACDALSIVLESADEREQTLFLVGLFAHGMSGTDYDTTALRLALVRQASSRTGYGSQTGEVFAVEAAHGPLASSAFGLERVRTALAATIQEVPLAGFMGGSRGTSGTHHLHRLLRDSCSLLDQSSDAGLLERRYSGLNESTSATDSALLPIELASEPILNAVKKLHFGQPAASSEAQRFERLLFATRFQSTFANAEPWLRELYLGLAARVGEPQLVPSILESALHGPKRQQELAIDALAAITGWDRRLDPEGRPRDLADVAREYAAECAR